MSAVGWHVPRFRQSRIAAIVLVPMPLECEELTGSIIGAAITVHRELGPGFIESVYGNALDIEMRHRQIPFVRQLAVPVLYRDVEVGMHRLDLFVADEIVVELKAVKELTDVHFAVVRSYLRATQSKHGLILNFAKYTLQAKRVVALQEPSRSSNGCCGG